MSDPEEPDVDGTATDDHPELVAYEDEDAYIICDRSNPDAWIRSTVTMEAEPAADSQDRVHRQS